MIRPLAGALGALAMLALAGCATPDRAVVSSGPAAVQAEQAIDAVARDYVRLMLEIDARDPGFVDAYYGPPEWREDAAVAPRTIEQLAGAVATLDAGLAAMDIAAGNADSAKRARFLRAQINAARTRLRMLAGEKLSFRAESLGLFGATPDLRPLADYDVVLARIDTLVPGSGALADRVEAFRSRYAIPADRLKPVMDAAIAECRRRTVRHIDLPQDERFELSFVTGKPWSGYNYYQGDYRSKIEINTDLPVHIDRAVDLGCHEGYPGHHVLNVLLEQRLLRERDWVEFSVYPLYSPQSFIAEGSANYGIDLAFPSDQRLAFERDTLYPLAGLDPAGAAAYHDLQAALADLDGARFTIAELYLDGKIDRDRAIALVQTYQLVGLAKARQSVDFFDSYRSYVINYGLGRDMVRDYVERAGQDPIYRWAAMARLLSEPTLPADLLASDAGVVANERSGDPVQR